MSAPTPRPRRGAAGRWGRRLLTVVGIACIAAGVAVIAIPLYHVWQRGREDSRALQEWNAGGSQALVGAAPDSSEGRPTQVCNASAAPAEDYALVSFPSLPQYGYAQVAGDGTWDLLTQRSMVHYRDSPAPGGTGNVIIAFHREAEFEHIDELATGMSVTVQDRACHLLTYRVTSRVTVKPSDAQPWLQPTTGKDLTLITCTPWYVDTQRIVWRATLVG